MFLQNKGALNLEDNFEISAPIIASWFSTDIPFQSLFCFLILKKVSLFGICKETKDTYLFQQIPCPNNSCSPTTGKRYL